VPAVALGVAFVAAHHPDLAETDGFVAADGGVVVRGGVDHQPVMPAIVQEVARHRADGVRAQAPAVLRRVEEEVHRRVPVHRVVLFAVLHEATDDALLQHGEVGRRGIVERPGGGVFDRTPARSDPRRAADPAQFLDVGFGDRGQDDDLPAQLGGQVLLRPLVLVTPV